MTLLRTTRLAKRSKGYRVSNLARLAIAATLKVGYG